MQHFEELLMKWVVGNEQSFLVVENQHFKELIEYLNPKANTKSGDTLSRKVKSTFDKTRLALKEILGKNESKYSFTTDIWTSPSSIPFMAVTVHFIDKDFILNSLILDSVSFRDAHSGEQIASVLKNIVDEFGIKDKVLAVCTDNASNNDTFIQDLLDNGYIKDKECHIRCFAHVLNLSAQDSLKEIKTSIEGLRNGVKLLRVSPGRMEAFRSFCSSCRSISSNRYWM